MQGVMEFSQLTGLELHAGDPWQTWIQACTYKGEILEDSHRNEELAIVRTVDSPRLTHYHEDQ
jgi:hypothetical protein